MGSAEQAAALAFQAAALAFYVVLVVVFLLEDFFKLYFLALAR